jgi:hypothetical protein
MKGDLTLFLAIEKIVQDNMFLHQGMYVIKDTALAEILEVGIKELRTNIRNNRERFPSDFMTELREGEYAFSEPGILKLGGLLKSERAIKIHLQYIEYFVHLAHENGISVFDLINSSKT